ncbi:MAG TPA: hypothetical protein PKJ98_16675 [Verrucomicrobiota bacterium]|nr:hypothetical protein [Verrucomicrobiota bacterium]
MKHPTQFELPLAPLAGSTPPTIEVPGAELAGTIAKLAAEGLFPWRLETVGVSRWRLRLRRSRPETPMPSIRPLEQNAL